MTKILPKEIMRAQVDNEKVQSTRPLMTRSFVVPHILLDRSGPEPLRHQIHSQIASAILDGRLPHGARLPSSRLLAKLLGVSRNTVVDAYEALLESGAVITRPGSGVRISHAPAHTIPNFANLRRTAGAAHYPIETIPFDDPGGTRLYLNVSR